MIYQAPSPFSGTIYPPFLHVGLDAPGTSQFLKQLALLAGEVCWEKHLDARIEVTTTLTTQVRHPFTGQAEEAAILCFWWNSQRQFASIGGGHGNLASQHHGNKVNININIEVIPLPFKLRIGFDADDQLKIASRSSANAGLSFASNANLGTVINAGVDLDLDTLIAWYHALAATVRTGLIIDLTCSFTDRTDFRRLNIEGTHSSKIGLL